MLTQAMLRSNPFTFSTFTLMNTLPLTCLDLVNQTRPLGDWLICMHNTGELKIRAPRVDALFGVPQTTRYHPEVDTGIHVAMCLDVAQQINANGDVRWAVLTHDLGKGITPQDEWPRHTGHEERGIALVNEMNAMCLHRMFTRAQRLSLLVCEYHLHAHTAFELTPKTLFSFLHTTGMLADEKLLRDFVLACEIDKRGRLGKKDVTYPEGHYVLEVANAIAQYAHGADEDIKSRQQKLSSAYASIRDIRKKYQI